MKCPACKEPLVALELDAVEVDWCGACKGLWLDRGELEVLYGDASAASDFLKDLKPVSGPVSRSMSGGPGAHTAAHPSRRCPICESRMRVVTADWDGGIHLDECPRADGIWFDAGELDRALKAGGGKGRVPEYLSRVFGPQ
jgi:Zn-finger nucleic acid-binding protein